MNDQERVEIIQSLSCTEREARFLNLVALHSGYFLRRQYNRFLGQSRGGNAAALIEKLLVRRHARAEASCDRTLIYHLRRRSFYGLIGEPDNRHRRRRGSVGVKTKVMCLDLVLDRPDAHGLATEREKIDFFVDKALVPAPLLPAKIYRSKGSGERTARYFVEKFPVWITYDCGADYPSFIPRVSFAYVDPGPSRTEGFETFLKRYFLLFTALVRVRLVYASDSPARFERAERTFRKFKNGLSARGTAAVEDRLERFLRFLRLESWARAGQWSGFTKQTLDELRELRRHFGVPENESLLTLWSEESESYVRGSLTPPGTCRPRELLFEPLHLKYDYRLFGAL